MYPGPMDKDELQKLYEEAGTLRNLAERLEMSYAGARGRLIRAGMSPELAGYYLAKHGVKIRRTGFKSPRTVEIAKGAAHHNWKGGTTMHTDGYICEYAPRHPAAAGQKGYVLQHRLVMEQVLGRFLTPNELVHHINEDKADNRPENLELMDRSTHMSHHKEGFPRDADGRFSY